MDKLKEISSYTLEKFREGLGKGITIHDIDITRWTLKAQENINVIGFTALPWWVRKFKKLHRIVSRKITKFITKKPIQSKEHLVAEGNRFVKNIKYYITSYGFENI